MSNKPGSQPEKDDDRNKDRSPARAKEKEREARKGADGTSTTDEIASAGANDDTYD